MLESLIMFKDIFFKIPIEKYLFKVSDKFLKSIFYYRKITFQSFRLISQEHFLLLNILDQSEWGLIQ